MVLVRDCRYFGALSRGDARSLLENSSDGTFLVRSSSDPASETKYVLSVKSVAVLYCSVCHFCTACRVGGRGVA